MCASAVHLSLVSWDERPKEVPTKWFLRNRNRKEPANLNLLTQHLELLPDGMNELVS